MYTHHDNTFIRKNTGRVSAERTVILECWDYQNFPIFYNWHVFFFLSNQKYPTSVIYLFIYLWSKNNQFLVIHRDLLFCTFVFILGVLEERNILVWGLFGEFLFWILSPHSLKNSVHLLLRLLHCVIIRLSSSKLGRKTKAPPDKNLHNVHFQSKSEAVLL